MVRVGPCAWTVIRGPVAQPSTWWLVSSATISCSLSLSLRDGVGEDFGDSIFSQREGCFILQGWQGLSPSEEGPVSPGHPLGGVSSRSGLQ